MNAVKFAPKDLSLGDLETDNSLIKESVPIYESGRRTAWKERLIILLSRYCGCTFMTEKCPTTKTIKYYLVGRRNHIIANRILYKYFLRSIQEKVNQDVIGNGRIIINSYCLGFVDGIKDKINSSPTIAESICNEQEAKHYMHLTNYEVQSIIPCVRSKIDQVAFMQGKINGLSINFNVIASKAT